MRQCRVFTFGSVAAVICVIGCSSQPSIESFNGRWVPQSVYGVGPLTVDTAARRIIDVLYEGKLTIEYRIVEVRPTEKGYSFLLEREKEPASGARYWLTLERVSDNTIALSDDAGGGPDLYRRAPSP